MRRLPAPWVELLPVRLDGWDYYSQGVPCGPVVAYWSLAGAGEDYVAMAYAQVSDLTTARHLHRRLLGKATLETDNPGAMQIPEWQPDCRSVLFPGDRYGLADVAIAVRASAVK